jgi:O-methyltransferase
MIAAAEGVFETVLVDSSVLMPLAYRYLDLVERVLTRRIFDEVLEPVDPAPTSSKRHIAGLVQKALQSKGLVLARPIATEPLFQVSPPGQLHTAETLIGPVGLQNLRELVRDVVESDVPGDLIETGVWRGGATIYMCATLEAFGDRERNVWVADSFAGLPPPEASRYAEDAEDADWSEQSWLSVPSDVVRHNFERYALLDQRVRFLEGWFHETLVDAPIEQLSLMRLDGDMYGSTMDALEALYPKLSPGGIDDYWLPNCRKAVTDYRDKHAIRDELVSVDRAIVYWQRAATSASAP